MRILLVDDEASMREMTSMMLRREGWEVITAADGVEAIALLEETAEPSFDLVVTDLKMGAVSGMEVLAKAREVDPSTQVVVMTAYASTDTAVNAMRLGAYDYIEKPFKREAFIALMLKALEKRRLLEENFLLRRQVSNPAGMGQMVGKGKAMLALYEMIRRVAPTKTNVLITGESGTGKELVARAIHDESPRAKRPFVPINCGAIPETLIESELFGHAKGAFTGAQRDKAGLFTMANGGTLFLDEVGELPQPMQVKLLRAIQERRIQPVGGTAEVAIDVRLVAATNRDLLEEVRERRFREDLFYRLNVIQVRIPPLRERREDLPLLIEHFLQRYAAEQEKEILGVSSEAMQLLLNYPYPGNIRELENIVERAVTLEVKPLISTEVLPYPMMQKEGLQHLATAMDLPAEGLQLDQLVESLERSLLQKTLLRTAGNKSEAARILGITFRSLRYRLKKYGMGDDEA